jgi:replicative DNA helicase
MSALEQSAAETATLPAIDPKATLAVADVASEARICAAAIFIKGAIDEICTLVKPDDMHKPAHAEVLRAVLSLAQTGDAIDEATVAAHLRRRRTFDAMGGDEWLASLREMVPSMETLRTLATTVAELAVARRVVETARRVVADGLASTEEPRAFVERAMSRMHTAGEQRAAVSVVLACDAADRLREKWERQRADGQDEAGMPTGFQGLDVLMGGLRWKTISLVAALTGRGKSVFSSQVANTLAGTIYNGHKVGVTIVSGEMDDEAWTVRSIASRAGVSERSMQRVMAGSPDRPGEKPIDPHDADLRWNYVIQSMADFRSSPIAIYPRIADVNQVRAAVRDANRQFRQNSSDPKNAPRTRLLIVDYVQMMRVSTKAERHDIALQEFVYGLKDIADEQDLHVMALAQVNKGAKQRDFSTEDMKNSSALGEAAHSVIYLNRPALEMEKASEKREKWWSYAEFQVTKGRSHGVGEIPMRFEGEFYRFVEPKPGEFDHLTGGREERPKARAPRGFRSAAQ